MTSLASRILASLRIRVTLRPLPILLLLLALSAFILPYPSAQADPPADPAPAPNAPAPDAPAPQPAAPEDAITAEMTQAADYIAGGRTMVRSEGENQTLRFSMTGLESVKGPTARPNWLGRGIVLPKDGPTVANNEKVLVFARFDPVQQKLVLTARRALTPENLDTVRRLVAEKPRFRVTLDSDKQSYNAGDSVILRWKVENASATPLLLYTGMYSLQYDVIYDNTAHGTSTGGSGGRKAEDYVTIAPGQSWSTAKTLKGPFPEGDLGLRMRLVSDDNWVGNGPSANATRVDNVLMLREENDFSVKIAPLDAKTRDALLQQLHSPDWSEQITAMQVLSSSAASAQLPDVRAVSHHPWPAMRVLAAHALIRGDAPLSAEARALLFDPSQRVRLRARELISKRGTPDASLSLLALQIVEGEAGAKNLWDAKFAGNPRNASDFALMQLRDAHIGDLLAAQLRAGQNNGYVLSYLADVARDMRLNSESVLTDDQKAKLLAAWDAKRPTVQGLYTPEQLASEVKAARHSAFNDFSDIPAGVDADLVALLTKLTENGFYPTGDKSTAETGLLARGDETVPALLLLLRNRPGTYYSTFDSASVLRFLRAHPTSDAFDYVLSRAYDGTQNDTLFYAPDELRFFAPIALAGIDPKRARPYLERWFAPLAAQTAANPTAPDTVPTGERPKVNSLALGAAVALAGLGEKRAVPVIFAQWKNLSYPPAPETNDALVAITGQKFTLLNDWENWWNMTGKNQEWK